MGLCENDSFIKYSQEKLGRQWESRTGKKKLGQVQFQAECQAQHDQEAWSGNCTAEFVLQEAVIGCRSPVGRGGV